MTHPGWEYFAQFADDEPADDPRGAPTLDEVRRHRAALLAVASRYRASNVRIFGSVARGEANRRSDVDFLVDLPADYRLLELGGLYTAFEDVLGRPVHVAVAAELPEPYRRTATRDAVTL